MYCLCGVQALGRGFLPHNADFTSDNQSVPGMFNNFEENGKPGLSPATFSPYNMSKTMVSYLLFYLATVTQNKHQRISQTFHVEWAELASPPIMTVIS